jgi:zeaxanthin glucosyltransferase
MSLVVIFILPNPGGFNATLDLANGLHCQGHEVHYFGLLDSEAAVRAHGFAFTSIFEVHFPKGFLLETETLETLSPGLPALRAQREFIARINAFIDDLLSRGGEILQETLMRLAPDLVIFASADLWMEWPAFVANAKGLPCIYFHDSLSPTADSGLPPISSALIPRRNRRSQWQISAAWWRLRCEERLRSALLRTLGLYLDFDKIRRRFAVRYGYPLELCDTGRQVPRLTELVAWPRALEFAGLETPHRIYIGASVVLHRPDEPFPWDRLDGTRPLFYCALGSLVWFGKEKYRGFFQTIIEIAQLRPYRQWVIATGAGLDPEDLEFSSSDIVIVKKAPQLEILQRAHLMVTHGGANTIKECACLGVPMISFPLGYDHPGNTARLVYHGLGLRGDIRQLSVAYLEELILAIEQSAAIRERVSRIQAALREEQEAAFLPRIMDSLLANRKFVLEGKNRDGISRPQTL